MAYYLFFIFLFLFIQLPCSRKKKEGIPTLCNSMDGTEDYYAIMLSEISQLVKDKYHMISHIIYFERERKGGRKEKYRNINVWEKPNSCLLGTWPATQACALISSTKKSPCWSSRMQYMHWTKGYGVIALIARMQEYRKQGVKLNWLLSPSIPVIHLWNVGLSSPQFKTSILEVLRVILPPGDTVSKDFLHVLFGHFWASHAHRLPKTEITILAAIINVNYH